MDKSVIICKICNEMKERLLAGMYARNNKRWVDANGRQFNGKTCPDCHAKRVKNAYLQKKDADQCSA